MANQSFYKRISRSITTLTFLTISSFLSLSNGEGFYSLDWRNCTAENFPALASLGLPAQYIPLFGTAPNLDCAKLEVPVNGGHLEGKNITIGMTRYRAANPEKRIGSIIYNPGGPGGAASVGPIVQALGVPTFSQATVEHYDIIGMDPRGVGLSIPVKCDPDLYNKRGSLFPTDEADFQEMVAANEEFAESCRNKTGALFYHLDTTSAAHDIEAVRIALMEDKLNWLGISYGTQLGVAYAELYPEHVGRMVLDGNVDHSVSEPSVLHAESSAYEDVLNQFFNWCNSTATAEECPLKGQNLPQIFDDLVENADKSPIPAPGCVGNASTCRPFVTGEDIRFNIQGNGYLTFVNAIEGAPISGWPILAQVLNDTISGNATGLSTGLATSKTDASYPTLAIGCLDWYHNATTFADVMYKEQLSNYIAPHTKGASQSYIYQTSCIGWPAVVKNPNHALNQTTMAKAPPILMVNAYHDPETSYVWAEGLRVQIPSAILLSRNGSGHSSYPLGGAATALIDDYLVNETLPLPNTVVDS